jgi:hypothetical protein
MAKDNPNTTPTTKPKEGEGNGGGTEPKVTPPAPTPVVEVAQRPAFTGLSFLVHHITKHLKGTNADGSKSYYERIELASRFGSLFIEIQDEDAAFEQYKLGDQLDTTFTFVPKPTVAEEPTPEKMKAGDGSEV